MMALSKELKTRVIIRTTVIIILTLGYKIIGKLNIKSLLREDEVKATYLSKIIISTFKQKIEES